MKIAVAILPILPLTSYPLEIIDSLTAELTLSPSLCGEKVEIFSRAGNRSQALETLKEIVESLKNLGFSLRVVGFSPAGKGERATAKVTLILENPRQLDRLIWTLENIGKNYPSVQYSLSGEVCNPQSLDKLEETLREILLKKAKERTKFFSERLRMECRLKEFQMEGVKLISNTLVGEARVSWVCYP